MLLLLLVSLAAHVIVVMSVRWQERASPSVIEKPSLQVRLQPPDQKALPTPRVARADSQAPEPAPEPAKEPAQTPAQVPAAPAESVVMADPPSIELRGPTTISESAEFVVPQVSGTFNVLSQARDLYGKACSEKEKLSAAVICLEEADPGRRRYADLVASLTPRAAAAPSLKASLDRVDEIMAEVDRLAALDPDDPAQAALLAQQRRHLREEILLIDQRLASVNLLRLVPMARKFVSGLDNIGD